jgi:ketosteroid isomerase-like protein
MVEHPNARLVRDGYNAATHRDPRTADFLADDVEWHEIGSAEPIVGKPAVLEHLAAGGDWTIHPTVHDVVASDEHAAVMIEAHAVRGDRTLEYRVAEFYDLRNGKVAKRWAFSDDTARIADFFR